MKKKQARSSAMCARCNVLNQELLDVTAQLAKGKADAAKKIAEMKRLCDRRVEYTIQLGKSQKDDAKREIAELNRKAKCHENVFKEVMDERRIAIDKCAALTVELAIAKAAVGRKVAAMMEKRKS